VLIFFIIFLPSLSSLLFLVNLASCLLLGSVGSAGDRIGKKSGDGGLIKWEVGWVLCETNLMRELHELGCGGAMARPNGRGLPVSYRYYLYRYISTCIYRACTIPTPVMDKVLVVEEILKMYDHTRVVYR